MTARDVFVGCDWGSTSFRLRVVEFGTRRVLAEQHTTDGIRTFASLMAAARSEAMAEYVLERLTAWSDLDGAVPIVVSGMASSNVGWRELPYATAPFPLDGSRCPTAWVDISRSNERKRTALLISGVRTTDDIMRGEECALIGANVLHPRVARNGATTLALLAGTHPKHALLRDGALVSFHTHLTGELFDALAGGGLIAASVDRAAAGDRPDLESFRAGAACARERGFSGALFQVRVRDVLRRCPKPANTWFLSGMLMGAELDRLADHRDDAGLLLIGEPLRVSLYRVAMQVLGISCGGAEPPAVDLAEAVVAGQEVMLRRIHTPETLSSPS